MSLPSLPQKDNYRREVRTEWGGINLNENAGDGELIEAVNMSSREYPLLATEWIKKTGDPVTDALVAPYMYGRKLGYIRIHQDHVPVDLTFYDPTREESFPVNIQLNPTGSVPDISYAQIGNRMCILPAKQVYDFEYGMLSDMDATFDSLSYDAFDTPEYSLCSFQDGTYGGVPASMNTIWCPGANWAERFSVGDAVTITGTKYNNKKSVIIQEIDGDYLRFYENTFTEELTPELYFDYPSQMPAGTKYTMLNGRYYTWEIPALVDHPVHLTVVKYSGIDTFFAMFTDNGTQVAMAMIETDEEPEGASGVLFKAVSEQYIDLPDGLDAGSYNLTLDGANYLSFDTDGLPAGIRLIPNGNRLEYTYGNPPMLNAIALHDADPPRGTELTVTENVYRAIVARTVPDMDFICANENRIWGCKGDTVYCSKQGDPYNWNVMPGISTDSWATQTGTPGDFTGCCSFQGYPTFFKENAVFKVMGDEPKNFILRRQNIVGAAKGCYRSIVEIRGQLYYISNIGAVAWNGGDYPSVISHALGSSAGTLIMGAYFSYATAGTDGLRYFIAVPHTGYQEYSTGREWGETPRLFVYDIRFGTWHEIDWRGNGYYDPEFVGDGNQTYMLGHSWDAEHEKHVTDTYLLSGPGVANKGDALDWKVTFADSTRAYKTALTGSESKKGVLRLLIRCKLAGSMKVWIAYDGGEFEEAAEFSETAKTSKVVPLILRRCDFWQLRLTGTGDAVIYSIAVEKYGGEWQQA